MQRSFLLRTPVLLCCSSTERKGRPSQSRQTKAVSVVMSCQGYKEGFFFFFLNISISQIEGADESPSLEAASVARAPRGGLCHRCTVLGEAFEWSGFPRPGNWCNWSFRCSLVNENWVLRNLEGPVSSSDLISPASNENKYILQSVSAVLGLLMCFP